jgi:hypothetical protein
MAAPAKLPARSSAMVDTTEALRSALKSQYHAALAMLGEAIERCPDDLWSGTSQRNQCWQVAYHALFFTHLYLQPDETSFRPWEHHVADVQYPDGIPGPPEPGSELPLVAEPYPKAQVLAYWRFCDRMVEDAVDALDLRSPESGFPWYPIPKLEHQMVNLRHIQHHAAQLADRVRSAADIGIRWVGARRPPGA